jgi:hypothetical protein
LGIIRATRSPFFHALALQPAGQGQGIVRQLAVAHAFAHADIGRALRELGTTLFKYIQQGRVLLGLIFDSGRNTSGVVLQPDFIHEALRGV